MASGVSKDIIKPFTGQGDVGAWIQKVELVAKLTKVKDVASFLPLYLEGNALAVYLELSDHDKSEVDAIKKALVRAFSDSTFEAFSKLKAARWTGEPVDVFANDIRRMARESGLRGDGLEGVVKLAFVTGFPDRISVELRQVSGIEHMEVSEILGKVRVLASTSGAGSYSRGMAAAGIGVKNSDLKCYKCNGPHIAKECPRGGSGKDPVTCYRCGLEGHIASRCSTSKRGPTAGRKCYRCGGFGHIAMRCTVDAKELDLPVSSSNTCAGATKESATSLGTSRCHQVPLIDLRINGRFCKALVDTGCTMSLARHDFVTNCVGESTLVAFDGRRGVAAATLAIGNELLESIVTVVDKIVGDVGVVIVRYNLKPGTVPTLTNHVAQYDHGLTGTKKDAFDQEVGRWIQEGILVPWDGEVDGIVPLMAVEQVTKNKVRPVLDFRELNRFVECHTGGDVLDVCSDRLREWRQIDGDIEIVDLKSAYLQIHVAKELWKYQLVKFNGVVYALTRLGFGLTSAPKIMSMILKWVLAQKLEIKQATSSYIDDIMVDVSDITAGDVVAHLKDYGLESKNPEKLDEGAVLGLKLDRDQQGDLIFSRANEIPNVDQLDSGLSRRDVFSICGKLVGHYPVAGCLRVACSYVKRQTEGSKWDDYAGDRACDLIQEVVEQVQKEAPVRGKWNVPSEAKGVVWRDASNLALGVVIDIGGVTAEDATWLRKKDDYNHINVAELESALKGMNLGVQWGLKQIVLMSDSEVVCGWLKATLSEERKIRTKGAAEMLIKRRLADLRSLHEQHHFGVERTWYLAKQVDAAVSKKEVKKVVRECERSQSIDPASVRHEPGELGVDTDWTRLAIDVTHYADLPYLTIVDCGPGRFAIWRALRNETAISICKELDQVFCERGPVDELLMDNATAFRSGEMSVLLEKWNTHPFYRAAYRASGNGIVERHHRTIKSIAERGRVTPLDAVFWYNISPQSGQDESTIPQSDEKILSRIRRSFDKQHHQ
ncbi:Gag-pro-pol polyprotein [Plakobranchus ocellatus]|uniref:Gag-pro-pol polyprotein n=1 Tax=Plakobranchus ocellatus TaxID=259542 RepID=A0AAV4AKV8_9GAST|nr:Gag-pro-pol polyprotein [Plakobranchus ocellatus]